MKEIFFSATTRETTVASGRSSGGVAGGKRTKKKICMRPPSSVLHGGRGPASLIICRAHICLRARVTAALSAAAGAVSHIFKYPSVGRGRRNSGLTSLPALSRGGRGERRKVTAGTQQRKTLFLQDAATKTNGCKLNGAAEERRRVGKEAAGRRD